MPKSWTLRASDEATAELRRLVKVWPRVIPAQQSNITADAVGSAVDELPAGQHALPRKLFSIPVEKLAATDIARLKEIFRAWPRIPLSKQREICDYATQVAFDE